MHDALKRISWDALSGPHRAFSMGNPTVRRYSQGFAALVGMPDPDNLDLDALRALSRVGEQLFVPGWSKPPDSGWRIDFEATLHQMVWNRLSPRSGATPDGLRLDSEHIAEALTLMDLTQPGPFGPRTLELGEYFGIFEGPTLIAMAGERMFNGTLREISGVCTHPEYRGQGLARRLVSTLIDRALRRQEIPFLHVLSTNRPALDLYQRMGFLNVQEILMRVISRASD
ncbi:MAG: GNAT family N-acetyltransferase [Betaproteobacteria bacterium]|nr:GNAT family N-acetyltransferase [Betaproteobacteria bacterium]